MDGPSTEHIEIVEGAGGSKARIKGTRIRVVDIVGWHEDAHWSAAEIVSQFPHLSMGDVYGAMAYYWDNKTELDARMAKEDTEHEEYIRNNSSRMDRLREKLKRGRDAS